MPEAPLPLGAALDLAEAPVRLLIVSDAWAPQVNGVVRTLTTMVELMRARGDTVEVIGPDRFLSVPMPGYREIGLAVAPGA
jgi:hypothetical protein